MGACAWLPGSQGVFTEAETRVSPLLQPPGDHLCKQPRSWPKGSRLSALGSLLSSRGDAHCDESIGWGGLQRHEQERHGVAPTARWELCRNKPTRGPRSLPLRRRLPGPPCAPQPQPGRSPVRRTARVACPLPCVKSRPRTRRSATYQEDVPGFKAGAPWRLQRGRG